MDNTWQWSTLVYVHMFLSLSLLSIAHPYCTAATSCFPPSPPSSASAVSLSLPLTQIVMMVIVNSVMGSLMIETSQWWSATVRGRELNDKGSVHDEVDRWGVVLVCHPGVVWRMWYVTTKLARGGGWEVSDLRRSWQQLPWVAPSSWWGWEVGRKRLSTSCATGC